MATSRKALIFAALPGVAMLSLFYSLAIHMHQTLGGWPTSIGEQGFPPALITHSALAVHVFTVLILTLFVLPVPMVVCLFVKRWRSFVVYLATYAGAILFSFALTQFAAPPQFINWWRD